MTDQEYMSFLSLMLQILGLIITFVLTFMCSRKKGAIAIGPGLMFVVNFVAQSLIAGEGPGAFVGAFVLPLYGLLVSGIALAIARLLKRDHEG